MVTPSILIVDDEKAARYGMRKILQKDSYTIYEAKDGANALHMIKTLQPALVFLDINMPQVDGMKTLEMINAMRNPPLVVIVTAYGSEKLAVEAMKNGAYDYIAKPYEIDELRIIVKNVFERLALQEENARLRSEIDRLEGMGELIGQSKPMKDVFDKIEKVGTTDVTVLIQGESGSGKEIVAREIYKRSKRRNEPFIIMNCAAVPETLIESELFGHEKGAFTGALYQRKGKFECAHHSTLFLDEVGDMPLSTQVKLLRVIEDGVITRIGSNESIEVDARLIAATNQDLEKLIKEGKFREDLYFRLNVVSIKLPPLRERLEDTALLIDTFLREYSHLYDKKISHISTEARKMLYKYPWPGNVRELKNCIESMVVVSTKNVLDVENIPDHILQRSSEASPSSGLVAGMTVEEAERELIKSTLSTVGGNREEAARMLGIGERTLYRKLDRYGLK